MAIAYVQSPTVGTGAGTTATTGSVTWAAGNIIIVSSAVANGAIAVNTISTSAGTVRWFALSACIRNSSPGVETWLGMIDVGGAFTITHNLSGSTNSVICAAEYSGVNAVGVGNSSAPAATANPSISLTTSDADTWVVGTFSANDTAAFTAGTGTLRASGSLTNVGGALVDNPSGAGVSATGTASVTHASATWGIGLIELYDEGLNYGNGVYSFGGTGTNGYLSGYNSIQNGVLFTTGANPSGYTLASASLFTNAAGSGAANLRCAIYNTNGDPLKTRIVESVSLPFGTAAGTGSANIHVAPIAETLLANTSYWVTWNNDNAIVAPRIDDTVGAAGTQNRYVASAFGAAPNPWGTTIAESYGHHVWVHARARTAILTPTYRTFPKAKIAEDVIRKGR